MDLITQDPFTIRIKYKAKQEIVVIPHNSDTKQFIDAGNYIFISFFRLTFCGFDNLYNFLLQLQIR